jgi:hypothetical protein
MRDEEPNSDLDLEAAMNAFAEYGQQRNQAFDTLLATIKAEFGCELQMTCSACPVQVEGQIDGLALYFRSRWGKCHAILG